jgi:nucleoside-diphosphate-sugar epimerase
MNVLITGGTGFIGKRIANHLLHSGIIHLEGEQPSAIDKITLFDTVAGENVPQDPRIEVVLGDLADHATVARITKDVDVVWHLAAVVSSAAEADFNLGMAVNITGLQVLLEALRALPSRPRLVNASGFAVFGGELPAVVVDQTAPTPKSSYGMQKAVGELLVAEYSRRGFIDGRSVRLPTITVRPGKPNKAASSFVSSIVREPLAGKSTVCPVRRETVVYVASPRTALRSMMLAMQLSEGSLGPERTIPLPGITVSIGEIVSALERAAGPEAVSKIMWEPDAEIQRIVESWPTRVDAARAGRLGFTGDSSFDEIIRAHIEDELTPTLSR